MKKNIGIFFLNLLLATFGFIILKIYESTSLPIEMFYFCSKPTFQTAITHVLLLSLLFIIIIILINLAYIKIGNFKNTNYLRYVLLTLPQIVMIFFIFSMIYTVNRDNIHGNSRQCSLRDTFAL